jgi:hypothetical protein
MLHQPSKPCWRLSRILRNLDSKEIFSAFLVWCLPCGIKDVKGFSLGVFRSLEFGAEDRVRGDGFVGVGYLGWKYGGFGVIMFRV